MNAFSRWIQSDRLARLASSRRLPWFCAALAVLVMLPTLWTGYLEDDHLFLMHFKHVPNMPTIQGHFWDLNVSGDGNPERTRARIDEGVLPWWADEQWKIAFWRPLAGALHWADWALFGNRAWAMHADNVLLYGMAVFVLTLLYRRMLTPAWAAALAGLMFLLDASHTGPVGWIGARSAPLVVTFIVLVVYFHDRWRRDGWRPGFWAALAALVLGLLASEGAVAAGAYLAGYALFVDRRGSLVKRFAVLLPYLAVVIAWRAGYNALGYGVGHTLLYRDPFAEPGVFALNVVRHLPVLLASLLVASEPGLSSFLPQPWNTAYVVGAAAILAFMAWALWPLLKRDRTARFWAVGMVLSALPVCTTFPQGRELLNPSIGAFALIALFVRDRVSCATAAAAEKAGYRKAATALAAAWLILHIGVSAVVTPVMAYAGGMLPIKLEKQLNETAPSDGTFSTMVIAYLPGDLMCAAVPVIRGAKGQWIPPYTRTLCAGVNSVEIERTDDRTLVIRPGDGFLSPPYCQVFRNPDLNPMYAGQVVRLTGFEATVLSVTPDGRPDKVQFRFDVPLDDPSLRWVTYGSQGYVPFTPPVVGAKTRITGLSLTDVIHSWFSGKEPSKTSAPG